jgi:hypothetical protein
MTNFERNAGGVSRMQPVMFVFILILGCLSFGPLMVSTWGAQEADAQTRVETQPDTGYSMTWVHDPDTPGKVKLAAKPRTEAQTDTIEARP